MQNENDDLLRRARELRERAGRDSGQAARDSESALLRGLREQSWVRRCASFLATVRKWLGPLGSLIAWVFGLIAKWFRWAAFVPAGPRTDGVEPKADFSWRRLALRSLWTAATVFGLHVLFSALYFYSTYFEEMVYVTGKQEIETGELYQFGGCTSLPCSTASDNGKFYLIESSLYFPVMLYPEENVFANIPQQNGACHVEGYGIYFRTLRWLYKSAQLYQHIVDVSCRPYTEDEIRRAVAEGQIVRE